jgi:hypothetical protein
MSPRIPSIAPKFSSRGNRTCRIAPCSRMGEYKVLSIRSEGRRRSQARPSVARALPAVVVFVESRRDGQVEEPLQPQPELQGAQKRHQEAGARAVDLHQGGACGTGSRAALSRRWLRRPARRAAVVCSPRAGSRSRRSGAPGCTGGCSQGGLASAAGARRCGRTAAGSRAGGWSPVAGSVHLAGCQAKQLPKACADQRPRVWNRWTRSSCATSARPSESRTP